MDLKDIASVSGKGGLFKVVKPTRNGVILETLDEQKNKIIATANNRVSLLKEISIYTTDQEGSAPLEDVFASIYEKKGKKIDLDPKKASNQELKDLLEEVLPNFDEERVYVSDIKKLVAWYNIVSEYLPEAFEAKKEEKAKTEDKPAKEEPEAKKAAPKEKKAAAKGEKKKSSAGK
ncbi:DUF5606 domain-containing protein [Cytophagaceae bacterium ABcell3]|nr:DUF5606 domain-containing protein [Cytophagaceae bacterium ABcell3]